MTTLRMHWGIEIAGADRQRSVVLINAGPDKLVARLLPTEASALMAALLRSAEALRGTVPMLVPDRGGEPMHPVTGGLCLTVTTYLPGKQPHQADEWLVEKVGSILGRIHEASSSVAPVGLRTGRDLAAESWVKSITDWTSQSQNTAPLRQWALAAHDQMLKAYRTLPTVLGHGDVHAGNVAIDLDVGLYDFGGCFAGARVLDIANALTNMAGESGQLEPRLIRAFLDGYTRVIEPTPLELAVLPTVAALDLIRIMAWIETSGHRRLGAKDARRQLERRVGLATCLVAELNDVGAAARAEPALGRLVDAYR